jgi:hypothetical protein
VRTELESGALVRILSDWDFGSLEVNALFVNGTPLSPLHAFTDLLTGTSTQTSCSIPGGYGHDSFTRTVARIYLLNPLAGSDAALGCRTNAENCFALLLAYTRVEGGASIIRTIGT